MTQDIPPSSEQQCLRASHVYLDASVYRALQFDWGGRRLNALADLARRGLMRVVVTEITLREVKSLMHEMWSEANKSMQRFAVALGQLGLGDAISAVADEETCVAKMQEAFGQWLQRCKVWTCEYDANLQAIMDDYFGCRPPFGAGKKKAEFADAIVVSMLRAWCAVTKQSVYVVSPDGDLKACCASGGPLIHAASVAEVVSHGTASAAVHDAVEAAVQESDWFFQTMQAQVACLDVEVEEEPGYEVEVQSVKLEEMIIYGVDLLDFDGTNMTCSAYLDRGARASHPRGARAGAVQREGLGSRLPAHPVDQHGGGFSRRFLSILCCRPRLGTNRGAHGAGKARQADRSVEGPAGRDCRAAGRDRRRT
jgi:hypothetical protein